MRKIYLINVSKSSTKRKYIGYLLEKGKMELIAPCYSRSEAKDVEMEYNTNKSLPPYCWECGIYATYLINRIKFTLTRARDFGYNYKKGEYEVFTLLGYSPSRLGTFKL